MKYDRIFDDPDGTLEQVKNELRQEYQVARNVEQFWGLFYDKNPELKGARRIVDGVFVENLQWLKDHEVPQAIDEIAALSRKELQNLRSGITVEPSGRSDTRSRDDQDREILVGGLDHGTPMNEGVPAPKQSLGSTILERRAARREGSPGVRLRRGE